MKQWWPRFFVMYLETSGLGAFNVGPALHFLIDISLNNCIKMMLQENHSIWSHQQLNCLFNSLFMPAVKKTVELHITSPLQGEPPWLADTPQQQCHYNGVIMSVMASQITSFAIVCSIVYLGTDQEKHQSPASLAFVRGIHQWLVNSPHKVAVMRKIFPFDDVIIRDSNVEINSMSGCHDEVICLPHIHHSCTRLLITQHKSICWTLIQHMFWSKYQLICP